MYSNVAMEVGKQFSEPISTKFLGISAKLVKVLHDILCQLYDVMEHHEDVNPDIEVVGLLILSLHFQLLCMSNLRCYVCLQFRENLLCVPNLSYRFSHLINVLLQIAQMEVHLLQYCLASLMSN